MYKTSVPEPSSQASTWKGNPGDRDSTRDRAVLNMAGKKKIIPSITWFSSVFFFHLL